MTNVLLYAVAVLVGVLFPVQAGVNSSLGKGVSNPSFGALVSGVGTAVVLLVYAAVARIGLPPGEALGRAPWWSWGGGVPGGMIVLAATLLAPKLGSAPFQALVVGGQLATSIALDHFGALGFPEHPAGALRLVGLALMLTGVFLIAKF